MKVTVRYLAQLKQAAGVSGEEIDLPAACTARELVVQLARRRGDALHRLLLDAKGALHPTILLFVGDEQVGADDCALLKDGDVITLLSPVAGG
jgi:molybdopterin converting factor small subunit